MISGVSPNIFLCFVEDVHIPQTIVHERILKYLKYYAAYAFQIDHNKCGAQAHIVLFRVENNVCAYHVYGTVYAITKGRIWCDLKHLGMI